MKKIIYLLLLFSAFANAQIVTIPDVYLKSKLLQASPSYTIAEDNLGNQITIDTNNDGEIQFTEALLVYRLDINYEQINQLTGIESFQNLTYLNCANTSVTSLNLTLTNLKTLSCSNGDFTNIDVSGLLNLENLYCSGNQLTSLNLSNLSNLKVVLCQNNLLSSINLTGLPSLYQLSCSNNLLTSINFNSHPNLTVLYCDNNLITSLSLNGLNNLNQVIFTSNQLSFLEIINCPQISNGSFANNLLSNINLSGNIGLVNLSIGNNNFSDVSFVTAIPNLKSLYCSGNLISNLDFVGTISTLENLNCSGNLISTLNVSNNPNFTTLQCTNNPNLVSVFLKIGREDSLSLQNAYPLNNNPNLQYVCVDSFRVNLFHNYFVSNNMNNVVVNSYCSFTPGGNFNTITGSIIYDENGGGCEATDLPHPNIKIDINDGVDQGSTFTNNSGNYKFYTDPGFFTLTPNMENPTWYNVSPTTANIMIGSTNSTTTQNFCITPNGTHPDLEIVVMPIVPARPGFDAIYKIVYKNKGNQTLSQAYGVNFFYNENLMDFVSASVAPTSINSGGLSWSYANLLPFESRSVLVTFSINAPTDTPSVNIGDDLQFTTSILPMAGDESTSDNTFLLNQTVVGAFDPNDITCLEGNVVSPSLIGEYLHYGVNFENTGNFEAENIVVKVEVNAADFDVNSLRLLNTSHNSYTKVAGNIVEFIFENIALSSGGHGNILLKVKSKNNLVTGDLVVKNAKIYFDYNAPIETNLESTVFQSLSSGDFVLDNSIAVFPNPTKDKINVKATSNIKNIHVYDVQGRLLETGFYEALSATVDLSRYNNGVYLLKISTDKGVNFQKVIKE